MTRYQQIIRVLYGIIVLIAIVMFAIIYAQDRLTGPIMGLLVLLVISGVVAIRENSDWIRKYA